MTTVYGTLWSAVQELVLRLTSTIPVAASIALLGVHVRQWWFYVADDSFISLRYADRLLSGQGLTWTDGEAVEGYSNLLWVLSTALLGVTGLDLLLAARLVGCMCGVGIIVLLAAPLAQKSLSGAWVAGASVAASTSVVLWIPGGLEQPLVALCMAGALASLAQGLSTGEPGLRTVLPAALALSALCWTRPDSPVLVAGLTLGWFLASGQGWASVRSAAALAVIPAGATLLQVCARLAYYGDWVPNTAHVKVRPSAFRTDMGALWTAGALESHGPLLLLAALALFGTLQGERPRARVRLVLPVLGAWLAWTVWAGGDNFPAYRHFAPLVVVFAWLAGSGVAGLASSRRGMGPVLAIVATGMLGWMAIDQRDDAVLVHARNNGWVRDAVDVGETLGAAFSEEQPLVAVSIAGAIPYASRLPSLDMIGLNDRHIGRTESVEGGWLGHDTGDGDYVFDKQPDLVFFRGPRGGAAATFKSEKQLVQRPDFAASYAMVRWQSTPHYSSESVVFEPWVRRSGALGPVLEGDRIWVPAWLLTEYGGTAQPDADGRMVLALEPGAHAGGSVVLPPGRWAAPAVGGLSVALSERDGQWRLVLEAVESSVLSGIALVPAGGPEASLPLQQDAQPQPASVGVR